MSLEEKFIARHYYCCLMNKWEDLGIEMGVYLFPVDLVSRVAKIKLDP